MLFPVTQLASKGREIAELADNINAFSENAIGIDAAISSCYGQGGVGDRAQNAAFSISKQSRNFAHLADALKEAAKIYTTAEDNICTATYSISGETYVPRIKSPVNMQYYNSRVSDTELLKLTIFAYEADDVKGDRAKAFAELLQTLPSNDPLSAITADQISYVHDNFTGFSAFVISDGTSATVVFPGTTGIGDWIANAELALGATSSQANEANSLVDNLSRSHSNIVVTGHSLGGYLATSVTLHNEGVKRCVSFDPPGRWGDLIPAESFDRSRAARVTTYENHSSHNIAGIDFQVDSWVSSVGLGVGEVNDLEVDFSFTVGPNHSRYKMYDALEKKCPIETFWNSSGAGGR